MTRRASSMVVAPADFPALKTAILDGAFGLVPRLRSAVNTCADLAEARPLRLGTRTTHAVNQLLRTRRGRRQ